MRQGKPPRNGPTVNLGRLPGFYRTFSPKASTGMLFRSKYQSVRDGRFFWLFNSPDFPRYESNTRPTSGTCVLRYFLNAQENENLLPSIPKPKPTNQTKIPKNFPNHFPAQFHPSSSLVISHFRLFSTLNILDGF